MDVGWPESEFGVQGVGTGGNKRRIAPGCAYKVNVSLGSNRAGEGIINRTKQKPPGAIGFSRGRRAILLDARFRNGFGGVETIWGEGLGRYAILLCWAISEVCADPGWVGARGEGYDDATKQEAERQTIRHKRGDDPVAKGERCSKGP